MEEDGTRVREFFSCMVVPFVIQTLTIHENVAIIVLKLYPGTLLLQLLHASIACGNWLEFKNNNSFILSIDQPRTSLQRSMRMFVQKNPIIILSCCIGTNFTPSWKFRH